MFKFFYSTVLIVAAAILIFIGFSWYGGSDSGPVLHFNGPESVVVGVPFDLEIGVSNDSDQVLQDAKIAIILPGGVVFVGKLPEETLISKKIGNLGVGSLTTQVFKLMVINGKAEDVKTIFVSVDYSPEFLGSRFKKEEDWQLSVEGSAIDLKIKAPDRITSGSELELKIYYKNISDFNLENLSLLIEYPPAFQYKNSTLKPDENNSFWDLGGLRKGSENNFLVSGKLIGPENSFFSFNVKINAELDGESYLISEKTINTTIKVAPLDLEILTNNVSEYIVKPDEVLKYKLNYNYLNGSGGETAVIKAKLKGKMFDMDSLRIGDGGSFQKKENTIVWSIKGLSSSGSVTFEIRSKNTYPIKRLGDRNFVLEVEAQMDDGKYTTVAQSENKVSGKITVDAQAFFRDADSGIINQGPFPPITNQPTDYTIHWLITNYSTDARNVVVRAPLSEGVIFTGASQSSGRSNPAYDSDSGQIIWEINRISATKGVISKPLEAIFQIKATPSGSAAGNYMVLIGKTTINAVDEFTGFPLTDDDSSLDTRLPDDKTVSPGIVVVK